MIKTPKPLCANCGKPYGELERSLTQVFCADDPAHPDVCPTAPPYAGNGRVLKENYLPDERNWRNGDRSMEVSRGTISIFEARTGTGRQGRTLYRTISTGELLTPNGPFCTLRCAASFGHGAYQVGYRIPEKK